MVFPIGNDRIGIVTDVQDLDSGDPVVSEYGQPQTHEVVVWVEGCLFEVETPGSEQQSSVVTTAEPAFAFLPVVVGQIPAVDDNNDPAPMLWSELTANRKLRYDGFTYVMRGDAVLERDIHGRHDHVFCACEREKG